MVSPTELAEAIIASLAIAMGLTALAVGMSRWQSGDRPPCGRMRKNGLDAYFMDNLIRTGDRR